MTSILTNVSAMVALQTLRDINSNLDETNDRVSTGLRIAEASDSAAFWAIATTTRSDNGALGAVKDALGLGRTTVDVAYEGLEAAKDGVQKIKELLVSARSPGVDRGNVQTEINGIITDLQIKASASVINEQNWLSVDVGGLADDPATREVVASFERNGGAVTINTIDVTIADTATPANGTVLFDTTGTNGILDTTTGRTNGNSLESIQGTTISALTDSAADMTTLDEIIQDVDDALQDVIGAMNRVGTVLSRIESQTDFVKSLIDANDRAIGTLVDADMEEESTKLRALQTQQQLAVQSLSIANTSAQNILSLFRN